MAGIEDAVVQCLQLCYSKEKAAFGVSFLQAVADQIALEGAHAAAIAVCLSPPVWPGSTDTP